MQAMNKTSMGFGANKTSNTQLGDGKAMLDFDQQTIQKTKNQGFFEE